MSENSPNAEILAQQLADLPEGLLSAKLQIALALNIGKASEALSDDIRETTFGLIADAVKSGSADALQAASGAITLALEFSKRLREAQAAATQQPFWQSKEVSGKLLELSQKDIFTIIAKTAQHAPEIMLAAYKLLEIDGDNEIGANELNAKTKSFGVEPLRSVRDRARKSEYFDLVEGVYKFSLSEKGIAKISELENIYRAALGKLTNTINEEKDVTKAIEYELSNDKKSMSRLILLGLLKNDVSNSGKPALKPREISDLVGLVDVEDRRTTSVGLSDLKKANNRPYITETDGVYKLTPLGTAKAKGIVAENLALISSARPLRP